MGRTGVWGMLEWIEMDALIADAYERIATFEIYEYMHISCFHKTSTPTMSALELTVVKVKKKFDLNTE